jgi:hypothetical protein
MIEFWQAIQPYSSWIVLGVLTLVMMRMQTGGGCGMRHGSHGQYQPDGSSDERRVNGPAGRPDERRSTTDGLAEARPARAEPRSVTPPLREVKGGR